MCAIVNTSRAPEMCAICLWCRLGNGSFFLNGSDWIIPSWRSSWRCHSRRSFVSAVVWNNPVVNIGLVNQPPCQFTEGFMKGPSHIPRVAEVVQRSIKVQVLLCCCYVIDPMEKHSKCLERPCNSNGLGALNCQDGLTVPKEPSLCIQLSFGIIPKTLVVW